VTPARAGQGRTLSSSARDDSRVRTLDEHGHPPSGARRAAAGRTSQVPAGVLTRALGRSGRAESASAPRRSGWRPPRRDDGERTPASAVLPDSSASSGSPRRTCGRGSRLDRARSPPGASATASGTQHASATSPRRTALATAMTPTRSAPPRGAEVGPVGAPDEVSAPLRSRRRRTRCAAHVRPPAGVRGLGSAGWVRVAAGRLGQRRCLTSGPRELGEAVDVVDLDSLCASTGKRSADPGDGAGDQVEPGSSVCQHAPSNGIVRLSASPPARSP